jgi:hypothetical protein
LCRPREGGREGEREAMMKREEEVKERKTGKEKEKIEKPKKRNELFL